MVSISWMVRGWVSPGKGLSFASIELAAIDAPVAKNKAAKKNNETRRIISPPELDKTLIAHRMILSQKTGGAVRGE
jgi:hypothetical protein